MFNNDNPKIIVDDDYLDLRTDQSRYPRIRPQSANTVTTIPSSVNTHKKVHSVKENLPGLKRILSNYNQKNSNPFTNKKYNRVETQPVDSRFRRKIDKKALSSRSESILQENESTRKETSASHSSDISTREHSSESETKEEIRLKSKISKPFSKREEYLKNRQENPKIKTKLNDKNTIEEEKQKVNEIIESQKKEIKRKSHKTHRKNVEEIENKEDTRKDDEEKDTKEKIMILNDPKKILWEDKKVEPSYRFCQIPIFKKSWTIPSMPLLKRSFSWTRHYNALCAKVDRKTYEFDTDDTISDTEDEISAYSSISKSNYMNLIFCLGCLCGIFLVGGILTASEIQADYFSPFESDVGMVQNFFDQISNTFNVVLTIFYHILTIPSLALFRTEEPKQWSFFDNFLYLLPE